MPRFTTRRYPYKRDESQNREDKALDFEPFQIETLSAPDELAPKGTLYRLLLGLDPEPAGRPMTQSEQQNLQDPFAQLILSMDVPALSLETILAQLDLNNEHKHGLPEQNVFMIAEGSQIAWNEETSNLDRQLRVVVTRSKDNDTQLMISTTHPFDAEENVFLQVVGWDDVSGVFNFYERRAGKWFWAGNSWHALNEPTRGRGPFDSHVNGSVVMKELRAPWVHWHSQAQSINFESFGPGNPLQQEPLLENPSGAENLEVSVIVPLIEKWTRRRIDKQLSEGKKGVNQLMRQILTTTSFNLVSSPEPSSLIRDNSEVRFPTEFFVDKEGLFDSLDILPNVGVIKFSGEDYNQTMQKYDVCLKDERQQFEQSGDAFYPFLTPCRAFEDTVVLQELLSRELISEQFAATLLMIDFPNPIGSAERASLMRYVPDVVDPTTNNRYPIQLAMISAINSSISQLPPSDPALKVIEDMQITNWRDEYSLRITNYLKKVQARARTLSGFDDYFKLLESRRGMFRKKRLSEFDLTLPSSNISTSVEPLMMLEDGHISAIHNKENEDEFITI